jgi:flavin-dependent dehydrogenase
MPGAMPDPAPPRSCDVVVLGDGPAGTAAAITAARLGLRTILVQKRAAARTRPVEQVAADFAATLAALGVAEPAGARPCRFINAEGGAHGLHLHRSLLDATLQHAAARAGAAVLYDAPAAVARRDGAVCAVELERAGRIDCAFVIDATGAAAWLRRRLGLTCRLLSPPLLAARGAVMGVLEPLAGDGALFRPEPNGWTFLAAHGGCVTWTVLRTDASRPRQPDELAGLPSQVPGGCWAATWHLVRPLAGAGWLIAGEAAGRVDPACGSGVADAAATGVRAARTAALCLADPPAAAMARAAYDGWLADLVHARAAELRRRYAASGIRLTADDRHRCAA